MKKLGPTLCLGVALARVCAVAQGAFRDLDFEQATVVPTYTGSPFIWAADAFPGWTAYAGGVPVNEVQLDSVLFDALGLDDGSSGAVPPAALDGRFSAMLGGIALPGIPGSIGQSGVIPAGSESLRFLAGGELSVYFAGHALPLQVLGSGPNASEIYAADISAYAGQYGQLLFQAGRGGIDGLDDITFSAQAIPEPGPAAIVGLGGVILCLRRQRRPGVARGLGPVPFGNPTALLSRRDRARIAQRDNAGIG